MTIFFKKELFASCETIPSLGVVPVFRPYFRSLISKVWVLSRLVLNSAPGIQCVYVRRVMKLSHSSSPPCRPSLTHSLTLSLSLSLSLSPSLFVFFSFSFFLSFLSLVSSSASLRNHTKPNQTKPLICYIYRRDAISTAPSRPLGREYAIGNNLDQRSIGAPGNRFDFH